jgi:hypothetical protein
MDIETVRLDEIVAEEHLSHVDFLKMDIEGAEIEALQGAVRTLRNTRKVAITAYHVRNGKPTAPFVISFLKSLGFNVMIIDKGETIVWLERINNLGCFPFNRAGQRITYVLELALVERILSF